VDYLKLRLDALPARLQGHADHDAAASAVAALRDRIAPLTEGEGDSGPRLKSIADALRTLHDDLEGSDAAPTEPQRQALTVCDERLEQALGLWRQARGAALAALNNALVGAGAASIAIPPVEQIPANEASPGKDLP